MKLALANLVLLILLLGMGCGDDTSGVDPGRDGGSGGLDCEPRCTQKYASCGGPAGGAPSLCTSVCGSGVTNSQVACLEAASCTQLEDVVEGGSTFANVCPAGRADAGGMDAGGRADDGRDGDPCVCGEGTGTVKCQGSTDGCDTGGSEGDLWCVAAGGGAGTCQLLCSPDEEGSQGSCPGGYTCAAIGSPTQYWACNAD